MQLQENQSVEVIDLNDDATAKDQESTPMSNMDEQNAAVESKESNADAGGDAEEFKSDPPSSVNEGEYHTNEF